MPTITVSYIIQNTKVKTFCNIRIGMILPDQQFIDFSKLFASARQYNLYSICHQWDGEKVDGEYLHAHERRQTMYYRRIISLVIAVILSLGLSLPVYAVEQGPATETNYETVDVLNGMARSLSIPTTYWNLGSQKYSATLEMVGRSMLYTNYYFKPNSNGVLYVDYDVVAQGAATFRIGAYNIDTGNVVASSDLQVTGYGKEGTVTFSSLDTDSNYAVFFMSVYDGWAVVYVSGSAEIYH